MPLSTILFPVAWFCVVFRVFVCALFLCVVFRDLLVFPGFQSSTFPFFVFFFLPVFVFVLFFLVFLGWLVSSGYCFGCILVPVPSSFSGVICLPSVISYCSCRIRHIGTGVVFWQFRRLWEQGCCFCAFSSFVLRLHWFSQHLTSAEDLLIFSYLFPFSPPPPSPST